MKYPIAIEPGNKHAAWGVVVPDLPGCFSAADSGIDEAIENRTPKVKREKAVKVTVKKEAPSLDAIKKRAKKAAA